MTPFQQTVLFLSVYVVARQCSGKQGLRNPKLFTGGTLTLELYNKIMDVRNPISGYTLRDIIPKVHLHPVYKDQGRTENPLKLENSMLFKVPPKADEQQALEEKLAQYANITLDMLRARLASNGSESKKRARATQGARTAKLAKSGEGEGEASAAAGADVAVGETVPQKPLARRECLLHSAVD